MIRRTILPVLVLALAVQACTAQTGIATLPLTSITGAPVSASPSTSVLLFTETPIPSVTYTPRSPALPVIVSLTLARVDFQDENNGWGIAVNNNGYVLRTVDGGRTWLNATPPGTGAIGFSANLVVLNADTAWLLVPGTDFFSGTLYRTSDGGVTWNSSTVPFGGAFIQFQNGSTGRALADQGARAGSEAVELFQTSDGGATWVSVFHNDSSQTGSSDSLPLAGIKNGMTFLNANTGWVTGSIPEDGNVYLYVTHDGGISWSQQSLPLPAGYAAYQYLPQAPFFFGEDGFLPLTVYLSATTDLTFYITHDGGLTWSGDPTNADRVIKPGLPAFADPLHAWSWDGGTTLFLTTDGTQTWQGTAATLDLSGSLSQLEFIPVSAGRFNGWALSRVDDTGHSQLYRTTDGLNWTSLIP